ncbi:hypothetical protein PWEIH_02529 [Listeria weihenstephanensis FSL R9-0317]|uniref:Lipoprotein n=1 Tax=Listeria weihenstephanensis TaxID=1006155 RepID=A0A1S7FS52_9LIST|nr:hypothetical protein [Listeria weihenstephanensis]AQY50271.1 hypothetical protein UE46_03980 [Listeria weihenstephanensis]EUJ40886.1 hypothetical protein PWEIH_02529 [Listeria weihenstephanensis FSL R9-0317]
MKLLKVILMMFLLLFASGCSSNELEEQGIDLNTSEATNLVYDGAKLVKFDMKTKMSLGDWDTRDNQFQYVFPNSSKYITSGNSTSNEFEVFVQNKGNYKSIYKLESKTEALFPFAISNNKYLFAIIDYSKKENSLLGILEVDSNGTANKKNIVINDQAKNIFEGISSNTGEIYALIAENGGENLYETNEYLSQFTLISKDVKESSLSTYKRDVVYVKGNQLYSGLDKLKDLDGSVAYATVIADNYILQVMSTGRFTVEDMTTNETLLNKADYLGYQVDGKKVTFFATHNLYTVGEK